jgi:tRNA modification GTPase
MLALDDTIAAIATPPGAGAARGIVRVSGQGAVECLRLCFASSSGWGGVRVSMPVVISGALTGPLTIPGEAYIWPSRRSYTREPVVEFHTLGSPPLLDTALRAICNSGARLAQAGEFTLRAFLAGRLDLAQAEAVLGVIDARDRRELDVAIAQMAGGLTGPLRQLRGELLDLLADLEAGLDFVEEHIQFVTSGEVIDRLASVQSRLQLIADALRARAMPTGGPRVAIVGWPNTGKSSLYNALVENDRSLVSGTAGTTRDYLQAEVEFAGTRCVLIDTAGIDGALDHSTIEAAAQYMTDEQSQRANLRLFCIDATRALNEVEREMLARTADETLIIRTKCDSPALVSNDIVSIETSAVTRQGLETLGAEIAARLASLSNAPMHAVASTAARCRESIARAAHNLACAEQCCRQAAGDELVSAELRTALDELGKVTGAIYTEDVLDRVFSRFCIGK